MRALLCLSLAALASGCALYDGLTGGGCDATPFFVPVNQTIPDNNLTGISSSVEVGLGIVDGVTVSTDTEHQFPSELNYRLSHGGVFVELDGEGEHDVGDFDGLSSQGIWTMTIHDDVQADPGYWYSWEIAVCIE